MFALVMLGVLLAFLLAFKGDIIIFLLDWSERRGGKEGGWIVEGREGDWRICSCRLFGISVFVIGLNVLYTRFFILVTLR